MGLIYFLVLLALGYGTGTYIEKRHYKSIIERERALAQIPLISGQWKAQISGDEEALLFGSGVVIGADYFKFVVSNLRNIFGGKMSAYETLLDRGRREALLRMKAKAANWGAEKIVNVRIETSTIGGQRRKGGLPCVELFAYGTALKQKHDSI